MNLCACCGQSSMLPILDFGTQPICNRFLRSSDEPEERFPLGISVCERCGLIAMTKNVPAAELRPRFDWISYKEAEAHLNNLAGEILAASNKAGGKVFHLGLSSHDMPLLERVNQQRPGRLHVLDVQADIGAQPGAGIETIQGAVSPVWAANFLQSHPAADLVVARYVLEHAQDAGALLSAVRALTSPDGLAVFEVPDFSVSLSVFDYSNIWEEHAFYFTPATLRAMLEQHGFKVEKLLVYPYPLENSLVAICKPVTGARPVMTEGAGDEAVSAAKLYAAKFPERRTQIQSALGRLAGEGNVAVFGASHLAAKFINLLGLAPHIQFVADDHPMKQGLFMPGSRLPIKPSVALASEGIRWCLLSLNPESEERVLKNLKALFDGSGIRTYSIFQASPRALPLDP